MTRAQKAAALFERLERGPIFSSSPDPGGKSLTKIDASSQYRNWAVSWVLDDLVALIPELRKKKVYI